MNGSGVRSRLAYDITQDLTAGVNISYDEAFNTRVSAELQVRFGGASKTEQSKKAQQLPVINALVSTPSNRGVRVHDTKAQDLSPTLLTPPPQGLQNPFGQELIRGS